MKELSEEKLNLNYLKFIEYLQKYNCYSESMIEEIGELIKLAPMTMNEADGGAYPGAMIDITLNVVCKIGFSLNEKVFGKNDKDVISYPALYVNNNVLIRSLLIMNISKSITYVINQNEWSRKNGKLYEFNPDVKTTLKLGQRCLYMCNKYGITLSEEEFEAITNLDKDDNKNIPFLNPLSFILDFVRSISLCKIKQEQKQLENR